MQDHIEEKLIVLLQELVTNSKIQINLNSHLVNDLELDSLAVVDMSLICEDEFGIEIFDDDLDNIYIVRDVVQLVKSRL
jgi:acyl carrier protein